MSRNMPRPYFYYSDDYARYEPLFPVIPEEEENSEEDADLFKEVMDENDQRESPQSGFHTPESPPEPKEPVPPLPPRRLPRRQPLIDLISTGEALRRASGGAIESEDTEDETSVVLGSIETGTEQGPEGSQAKRGKVGVTPVTCTCQGACSCATLTKKFEKVSLLNIEDDTTEGDDLDIDFQIMLEESLRLTDSKNPFL